MSWLNSLIVRIKGDSTHLDSTLKKTESGVKTWSKKIFGAIGAAFAITAITRFLKETIKLAAEVEGIRKGFEQIAEPGLLDDLRKATKGTVSDMQLMSRAIMASNFQIPLEQLADLLAFASARAVQTGQSVDYLVNSIVLGIGRKSPLILDNLGISAVRLREVLKGAGAEVTTVGDIAAAVGKIGAEELDKMGGMAETAGTKIQGMAAAMENLRAQWGKTVTESNFFKRQVEGITLQLEKLSSKELNTWQKLFQLFIPTWNKEDWEAFKDDLFAFEIPIPPAIIDPNFKIPETLKTLNNELKLYQQLLEDANIEDTENIKNLNDKIKLTQEYIDLIKSGNLVKPGSVRAPAKITAPKVKGLTGLATESLPGIQGYSGIDSMTKEFGDMQIAIMELSDTFASFFSGINLGFQAMIDGIITGIKRLVMELMAKAVWLAILGAITGVPLTGGMFKNLLFGSSVNTLIKGGALGTGSAKSNIPASGGAGNMSQQLVATLRGRDIEILLRRS